MSVPERRVPELDGSQIINQIILVRRWMIEVIDLIRKCPDLQLNQSNQSPRLHARRARVCARV